MITSAQTVNRTNTESPFHEVQHRLESLGKTIKFKSDSVFQAQCPAHEDSNPSLTVTDKGDKVLLYCHRGCDVTAIISNLSMKQSDLFQNPNTPPISNKRTHNYPDEDSIIIKRKIIVGTGKKTGYWQTPDGNGGWQNGLNDARKIPYNLPGLIAGDGPVFIPEGEKDVDSLIQLGLTATTAGGSSDKWRKEYGQYVIGKDVIVLGDRDVPGRKRTEEHYNSLIDTAKSVKVIEFPGDIDNGYDITDWLRDGGDYDQLMDLVEGGDPSELTLSPVKAAAQNKPLSMTDLGNSERLVYYFGDKIRYHHQIGKWLIWDGMRWKPDDKGKIRQYAKATIKNMWQEAAEIEDQSIRNTLIKFISASRNKSRIDALIDLAKSEGEVPVVSDELDRDQYVLNCQNGTVDLKNGTLKKHTPGDNITKLAKVKYDTAAECPLWLDFVGTAMGGDEEKILYLQKLTGLFLTGDISEQILPIFYGTGGNGKSVYLDTVVDLLGDYAAEAPPSLITDGRNGEHPTEIADLCGLRLAIVSETEANENMKTQRVKQLTGNAKLKARFMRQDYFSFDRTHKTLLVTNNRPVIEERTNAIWRRIKLVPFDVIIPDEQQDKHLFDKLKAEWSGILKWAVDGCVMWQHDGLKEPDSVKIATQEYEAEQHPLDDFFEACCTFSPYSFCKVSDLRQAYDKWALKEGVSHVISVRKFNIFLREKGLVNETMRFEGDVCKCWNGIDLRESVTECNQL